MRLLICAVGLRQPAWADAAFADYAKRLPPEWKLELKAVKAEPRDSGKTPAQMMAAESLRLAAALPRGTHKVVLDEHGTRATTRGLADRLAHWQAHGLNPAFVIGGPDGLDPGFKANAAETLRLSDLTLPHAMARVLLAEALYRAHSLHTGHPYHRD
jgi:23S rRNA (pseudouridine1915-N3)-methyltransferase